MGFKGRFFSSKKSDTSSPDGSNNPRSFGSNSPIRSEKKKVKSSKEDPQIASPSVSGLSGSFRKAQVKDGLKLSSSLKKKDEKGKETPVLGKLSLGPAPSLRKGPPEVKEAPSSVSPILASSLGLNWIKTRSGPLPQESFFGFRGDKGLGVSNLSKIGSDGCSSSGSGSYLRDKKQGVSQTRMGLEENVGSWLDNGRNSDNMSTESGPSRDQSPQVQTRL